MADETPEQNGETLPPKIRLGNGSAKKPAGQPPPRKTETTRIDLASAQAPVPPVRTIKFGNGEKEKKKTSRLDPSILKPISPEEMEEIAKKSTIRIDTPAAGITPSAPEDVDEAAKKSTVRIEGKEGMTPMAASDVEEATKKSTVRIDTGPGLQPLSPEQIEEAAKKSTIRIETAVGMQPLTEEDKAEASKKSTVRVQVDEERAKGDTARLDTRRLRAAQTQEAAKKRTARIDLSEVLSGEEEEDIFKRRTALLDASKFQGTTEAPGAPRTIRIRRPEATPPTAQLGQPPVAEAPAEPVAPAAEEVETARKSETARIDLPPEVGAGEQPPTRRKTIRIKRPEGGVSSKPLVIARTTSSIAAPSEKAADAEAQEASPVFAVLALVADLLVIGLITVQILALRSYAQF